eukprot:TRINITY_DN61650_c0_g1_i1.p1 TRINITY_DN61650_c0_g1~~TRINITY_DN61650_c0_g1_i1.p1  ORF type:complete len:257 (+),score=44.54 TRINITY_DN61650_c0_g1_i1:112-882(+)
MAGSVPNPEQQRMEAFNKLREQPMNWRVKEVDGVIEAMQREREFRILGPVLSGTGAPASDAIKTATKHAAGKDRYALIYASQEVRSDKEVALVSAGVDGNALLYMSDDLRADFDVVLKAVQNDGNCLRYADPPLRGNKEIALAAVQQNGRALRHVSDEMQNDRDVVLAAVRQDGRALRHASDDLKGDKEVASEAVAQDRSAYAYVIGGKLKSELEDWMESEWGLPIKRQGCMAGQSLYYRDCKGIDRTPADHPEFA